MKLTDEQSTIGSGIWMIGLVMIFIGLSVAESIAYAMIVTGSVMLFSVFVVVVLRWAEDFKGGKNAS